MMFSNGNVEKLDDRQPEMLIAPAQNPRILANARKSRSGVGPDGKPLPKSQVIALRDAIFEAMLHRFSIDPTMAAFGEENRDWGGAFAVYRGLTEALPYHRLFNTLDLGGGDRRRRGRLRALGRQGRPRAHVLRLPGQVG